MKKNCERCGTEFEPRHPSRKYCSSTCKQYAYFERNGMSLGNSVKAEVKAAEDNPEPEQNEQVIEIPVTQQIKPEETSVKDEQFPITPITEEKIPVLSEKKIEPAPVKQNTEPSITMTMDQLEALLKKVAKDNQQEKVVVIEKHVPVIAPVKEVNEEVQPVTVITPQPKPEPQKERPKSFLDKLSERVNDGNGVNSFTKDHYPNWSFSQWDNVKCVNERVKNHFKKLVEFTKRPVDISVVKFITKQMNDLVGGFYFKYLPADYPFTDFVEDLAERMIEYVKYLEKEEIEKVKIKISEEKYIEMKAIIAQIGTTVQDVDHSTPTASSTGSRSFNRYERRAKLREWGINPKNT